MDHLHEIYLLAYADDLTIPAENKVIMKRNLHILDRYYMENDSKVNANKTKIVIFQKGGHHHNRKLPLFYFGDKVKEIAKEYNYLSIIFTQSCCFRNMTHHADEKTRKAIGAGPNTDK